MDVIQPEPGFPPPNRSGFEDQVGTFIFLSTVNCLVLGAAEQRKMGVNSPRGAQCHTQPLLSQGHRHAFQQTSPTQPLEHGIQEN